MNSNLPNQLQTAQVLFLAARNTLYIPLLLLLLFRILLFTLILFLLVLCPIHVVTFTLISNLATDYIQKRRGEPGLFSFE